MHLAIALEHGVGAFVTADRDFRRLRMVPATQLTIILV
jgi:predicted nucleic acid-binding protein